MTASTVRGVLLLALFVTGCASVPIHYYTLSPPATPIQSAGPLPSALLQVQSVQLSGQLNRSHLVVRQGTAEVTLLENERWASPLNDELRLAIQTELQLKSSTVPVLVHDQSAYPVWIVIRIERFEADFGDAVYVEATWNAVTGGPKNVQIPLIGPCRLRSREPIGSNYPSMVGGFQRAIQSIADGIAVTVSRAQSAALNECGASG